MKDPPWMRQSGNEKEYLMPKYTIYLTSGASASVRVEAEDLESAVDAAFDGAPHGVCAQCGGWNEDWSLDIGDDWDIDKGYEVDGKYVDESPA